MFVRDALAGWLIFVLGPGLYSVVGAILRQARSRKTGSVIVGPENEFVVGSSRLIQLGDERVLVVRGIDGIYHAVGAECTHLGCSIRYEPRDSGKELACNCHNSRFDLNGETGFGIVEYMMTGGSKRYGVPPTRLEG